MLNVGHPSAIGEGSGSLRAAVEAWLAGSFEHAAIERVLTDHAGRFLATVRSPAVPSPFLVRAFPRRPEILPQLFRLLGDLETLSRRGRIRRLCVCSTRGSSV